MTKYADPNGEIWTQVEFPTLSKEQLIEAIKDYGHFIIPVRGEDGSFILIEERNPDYEEIWDEADGAGAGLDSQHLTQSEREAFFYQKVSALAHMRRTLYGEATSRDLAEQIVNIHLSEADLASVRHDDEISVTDIVESIVNGDITLVRGGDAA